MLTVLDRIQTRHTELTDAEKIVASWLQAHIDQLAFKPAGFIAQQCNVSESTVVRFARKLGYESYPDMQNQVQTTVQQQLSLRQKLAQSRAVTSSDQVLDRVFAVDIENLRHSSQTISPEQFQKSVQRLVQAEQVGVIGLRASAAAAEYLSFTMNLIRPRVRMITNHSGDLFDNLLDFGPRDAVVLISLARAAPKTLEAARFCARRHVPMVGITDWQSAPLASLCDPCLKVSAQGLFWESYAGVITLCNALVTGVGLANPAAAEGRLKELEEASVIGPINLEEDL